MWRSPLLLPQSNTRPHGYKRTQISAAVVFILESCGMTKIFLFICEFLSLVAEVTQFRSRINLGLLCTRIARENVCYLSTRIKFSNCAKVNHRTVHLAAQKNPDLFILEAEMSRRISFNPF